MPVRQPDWYVLWALCTQLGAILETLCTGQTQPLRYSWYSAQQTYMEHSNCVLSRKISAPLHSAQYNSLSRGGRPPKAETVARPRKTAVLLASQSTLITTLLY
uniref:Putative secreted protein n=1 Tax=Ixodes ricinus TaxID=34613 RepID=A0A6B0U7M7_IXORI